MSWDAWIKESTVKIPRSLIPKYRKWAQKQGLDGFIEINDDGTVETNPDAGEHYETVVRDELMPFVKKHPRIQGRMIYIDEEQGLVGYEVKGGRLYKLNSRIKWTLGREVK